jgi:hypothetical protein
VRSLTVSRDTFDETGLLRNWRWLVPDDYHVLCASLLGDLFLTDSDGRVFWLDVGGAELSEVAASVQAFEALRSDREQSNYYFGPVLVEACTQAGLSLGPGECYSYVMLPMLGGAYDPSNLKARTLQGHIAGWGPICEKLAQLPDGAQITFDVVP